MSGKAMSDDRLLEVKHVDLRRHEGGSMLTSFYTAAGTMLVAEAFEVLWEGRDVAWREADDESEA